MRLSLPPQDVISSEARDIFREGTQAGEWRSPVSPAPASRPRFAPTRLHALGQFHARCLPCARSPRSRSDPLFTVPAPGTPEDMGMHDAWTTLPARCRPGCLKRHPTEHLRCPSRLRPSSLGRLVKRFLLHPSLVSAAGGRAHG